MRSPAARWTLVVLTWIALTAAGFVAFQSHKQTTAEADTLRNVDRFAREAQSALSELRVAEHAYVAAGQGVAFWMPKVESTAAAVNTALAALRQSVATRAARTAVDAAASAMTDFAEIDKRARDYIRAGQQLMAGDVIFTEAGQATANVAREVELARLAEHEEFDAREGAVRKQQATVLASAGIVAALFSLLLVPAVPAGAKAGREDEAPSTGLSTISLSGPRTLVNESEDEGVVSHAKPAGARPAAPAPAAPVVAASASAFSAPIRSAPVLKAAAELATDFGRVRDSEELSRLLKRSADMIDATGLVVWLGDTSGGELRPVIAHGYSPQMLARIPAVPRNADNAAAAAYRSGTTQIVLSRPGGLSGAIVAPILGVDGCVGALSAEIQSGGEGSEAVQAVTAIVASHLAAVLGPAAESELREQPRIAAQS